MRPAPASIPTRRVLAACITGCGILAAAPAFGATVVTWGQAPDFAEAVDFNSEPGTGARDVSFFRSPAQSITVEEAFTLDKIYIHFADVLQTDSLFSINLASGANFDPDSGALLADPSNDVLADNLVLTPAVDPGDNQWVEFDVDDVVLTPGTYALWLDVPDEGSNATVATVNRSSGNYDGGQYYEQRNGGDRLVAPINGSGDLRFALVPVIPEPTSLAAVAVSGGLVLGRRRRD